MTRIETVQRYADRILETIVSPEERRGAVLHTYGVAQLCSLLAVKRGLDPELACVCGLLHDVYSYKTGFRVYHSINGADMIRVVFKHELKDVFSKEEQTLIKSAVFHHSDKEHIHDGYDELLKDADVFQHWLTDTPGEDFVNDRLVAVQKELGLPLSKIPIGKKKEEVSLFDRIRLGDIAEKLAKKQISGVKSDEDYMEIIRYYPEQSAFDELKAAWCAAFVYHCAVKAGLELPIRYDPLANTRFACVEAWYNWGEENSFCFREKDGVTPSRGDIVIYDNIIPEANKPLNTPWYDHIGIVLSVSGEQLTVAEGNMDNKNVSGIVLRRRDKNVGCYLRIPEEYRYDGWKYDYKARVTDT